mmetsp:Transcript_14685/g.25105  ORF Transcript_14685/g.25105 Transcript_14685/m.25105 type:complete len:96 (+) Transcript_14685:176-463(+)
MKQKQNNEWDYKKKCSIKIKITITAVRINNHFKLRQNHFLLRLGNLTFDHHFFWDASSSEVSIRVFMFSAAFWLRCKLPSSNFFEPSYCKHKLAM